MSDITWTVDVLVMPKEGVNDPQGDAVRSGLQSLGFKTTWKVRVGNRITVEVTAADETAALEIGNQMCQQLLANPVIEQYSITAKPTGGE
ncbi:MAG: phosphoribosylformylglycinamidine synthase subunit PurS [Thermomicrobiales bacterium]